MTNIPPKKITLEMKANIEADIKEKYLKDLESQKDIALRHNVSQTTISNMVWVVLREMENENRVRQELATKRNNSEEEATKYGVPKEYQLIKK